MAEPERLEDRLRELERRLAWLENAMAGLLEQHRPADKDTSAASTERASHESTLPDPPVRDDSTDTGPEPTWTREKSLPPPLPPKAPPTSRPAAEPKAPTPSKSAAHGPDGAPADRQEAAFQHALQVLNAPPTRKPRDARSLERMIGERWAMIAGAIVVVIGVGLFFKLAYDQGWIRFLSPSLRCVMGAVFGALLLAGGEIARRRINAIAGAGLSAAGIGVVYTSAFAAYSLYALVSPPVAFILLVFAVAIGIGISARARVASVGVVSLIGGYLTPLLLHGSDAPVWFLPAYLTALLVVGLSLSAWLGGRFGALSRTAWWGTAILGLLWTIESGQSVFILALGFYAIVWSLVHAELIWSAPKATGTALAARALRESWRTSRHLLTSFATTAWSVGLGVAVVRSAGGSGWIAPLLGCVGALVAIELSGGRLTSLLKTNPATRLEELRAALALQIGALGVAAIGLGLVGWLESVAWVALGVAAVFAARQLRANALAVYGLCVIGALAAKALLIDSFATGVGVDVAGLWLTRWSLQMAVVGAGFIAAGWRMLGMTSRAWRITAELAICAGMTALAAIGHHEESALVSMIASGLTLGLALGVVGAILSSIWLRWYGAIVLAISTCAMPMTQWVLVKGTPLAGLVFTWEMALLLFSAVAWAIPAQLNVVAKQKGARPVAIAMASIAAALLMGAFLHVEADPGVIVLAWIGVAMLVMGLGFLARRLALEFVTIGVLAGAALAWLLAYPAQGWSSIDAGPLMHPGLIVLFFLVAASAVSIWRLHAVGDLGATNVIKAAIGAITFLVLMATSLEVARVAEMVTLDPRARRAAMSMWWGAFAIGLISVGFWRRASAVRYTGLALIGIAVVKALVFDMIGVTPVWRVVSVIGLGLLLLLVAGAYAKLSSRLSLRSPRRDDGGQSLTGPSMDRQVNV